MKNNRAVSVLGILFIFLSFSGCGKQEREKLKAENAALKAENAKLKETEQNMFSQAIDDNNLANKTLKSEDLNKVASSFNAFIEKYPNSQYVPEARKYVAQIQKKLENLQILSKTKDDFQSALSAHNFSKALSDIYRIKPLISAADYKDMLSRLNAEKNKPTTINLLVSKYGHSEETSPYIALVKVFAYLSGVDRENKQVDGYSEGCVTGSSVVIYYDDSNMESDLNRHDPDCNQKYIVTGTLNNSYNPFLGVPSELYIVAKKIEKAQ